MAPYLPWREPKKKTPPAPRRRFGCGTKHRLLDGAVVAIGNAPTTLYALLQAIRDEGAAPPAAILAFPVGFVGAAESKQALATLASACRT